MVKTTGKFAFIAGSALLDIVSTVTDFRHLEDNIGTTKLNFGGVAYNVAVNLRQLNVPTTLCSAINDSPISQMIMNELNHQQVRTHFKLDKTLPDGIYNGMFYEGKELASVWVNTVEQVDFDDSFIRKGLKNAACMLITSCLSVKSMNLFIAIANEKNIPVFIGGASLMEVDKLKDIQGQVDYYFINENEMNLLTKAMNMQTWSNVAQLKNSSFIVTKGGDGAELCLPDGTVNTYKTTEKSVSGNVLGAGDLFMSVTIKEIFFEGQPLNKAIEKSMKIASEILKRNDANIGTVNPLSTNIQMISDRAHHDKLTGAFNRHGIERYLTTPNIDVSKLHLLMIDADLFKKVNDNYGHDIGDEALISLVQVIKDQLRRHDIVARFGGEEFICLMKNMTHAQAGNVADRIRESVDCQKHTGLDIALTVSIGITKWQRHDDLDKVIKRADNALYEAKEQGRNKTVWN